MATVHVLGRVIVDLYANEIGRDLEHVETFHKYLGGSAGNTAVGLARLGASVGLISRVGNDAFGRYLLRRMQEEQVDAQMVVTDPTYPTCLAFAALFPPDDSKVLFYGNPNAHSQLDIGDIQEELLSRSEVLVVAGTALSTSPSRDATLWALERHRAAGGRNVMDMDWRPIYWRNLTEARLYYQKALEQVDVVLANEAELVFIGGNQDPKTIAMQLQEWGVQEVVAKRGSHGCWYFGPDEDHFVPAMDVMVLNTLGAGDGFGAAYVYGMLNQWSVEKRLRFATAAAGIVVSRHSCSEAMPRLQEIEALLAANP